MYTYIYSFGHDILDISLQNLCQSVFQQFSTMYLSLVPNRNTWLQHPAWYFFFKIFIHVQQFRLWFGQASRTGAGRSWCATWCAIANRQSLGILIGRYHWLSRTQYTIETKMSQPWFQNAKILKFFRLHEHFPNPSQGNSTENLVELTSITRYLLMK